MNNWTKAMMLLGLSALGACRTPKEAPRDYDGARRRATEAHSTHDAQENRMQGDDAR